MATKYKLPSYLQDKRVNDVLEVSKKIKSPSVGQSTFKATDSNFDEKTYNVYGTQRIYLPSISTPSTANNFSRQFVADTIAKKDKWNLANASTKSDKKREDYINKYFNNPEEFKKTYLTEEVKKDTKFTRFADKFSNTGAVKFLDRLSSEMADAATFKTGNYEKRDTGNKVANGITDLLGMGLGMATSPLGVASANKILSPIGNAAEKLVPKLSNPIANKLIPSAVRGASEFGALGLGEGYAKGEDIKSTLKNAGTNAIGGTIFGASTKALGMALPKLKNSAFKETVTRDGINFNNPTGKLKPKSILEEVAVTSKRPIINPGGKLTQSKALPPNESYMSIKSAIENQGQTFSKLKTKKINNKQTAINEAASTIATPNIENIKPKAKIVSSGQEKLNLKDNIKNKWNTFYNRMVDTSNPIKNVGDDTYTLATNSKNVGGTVDYILKDGLVDRQGKKIGSSLKEIAESVPKGQEDDFWEYVLQRHNVARATEGKPIYKDFTPQMSAEKAKYFESVNSTWKEKADNVTKWIDDFMDEWAVKSGITDKDLYTQLRKQYPNYVPTNRDFSSLEQSMLSTNGKGFVNQTGVIKKAKGSDRNITDPIENIMNLVNRTVRTAKYNEVGQSVLKEVRNNPDKLRGLVEIIPEGTKINSNVKNIVSVLENGKPVNVQINNKPLLESLQKLNQANVGDIEKVAKKATGLFKTLITQKNPFFAVRNIARDIPTAYINGSENNPIKFGLDLVKAGKDIATNSATAQQYRALGGGGSNFFNSDNVAKTAKELTKTPLLKRIGNGIEKFNNLTESTPRLAEFKRVANKTGDLQKGLFAANDVTTNFSRGGDITKHIDSWVPYTNASVQGMDKLARQFKNKSIATILKGATAITAPTLILNHINKDNPSYKELDNRTKDNYFLIPKEDGTFIKLPKSREIGVLFGSLTERILRQKAGEENAFKGFKNTLATNFGPADPIKDNILAPFAINMARNKDFANRTIVPLSMEDLSPQYQYDETTSEIAKKIGELTKKSPKQVDYLIKSYTGVLGQLLLPATTKNNKGGVTKAVTTQFTSDPLYSNQAITDFYDNYDKYKNLAADKNFVENIPSKTLTREENIKNYFAKVSKEMTAISKESRSADREGNKDKVRDLRRRMIELVNEANKNLR
jgi:hypothetical protein